MMVTSLKKMLSEIDPFWVVVIIPLKYVECNDQIFVCLINESELGRSK